MNLQDEIRDICARQSINGGDYWARKDGDIHAPAGFSTIDVLNTLGDIGARASEHAVIQEATGFVFELYDGKGCFRYAPKGSKLPCLTARIVTALKRLGCTEDERLEPCFQNFLNTQQEDGGWRCHMVKLGKSQETDASNPGTTLYVLDAFRFRENTPCDAAQLELAVQFLLRHWDTRRPLGPCQFGIGTRFMSVEYPFLRYNLFYYVYVLSKYRAARADERYEEALKILRGKFTDNQVTPETPHSAWSAYSFAQKGEYSEPATKRLQEILEPDTGI